MSETDANTIIEWVQNNKETLNRTAENIFVEEIFAKRTQTVKKKEVKRQDKSVKKPWYKVVPYNNNKIVYLKGVKSVQKNNKLTSNADIFDGPEFDKQKTVWLHDLLQSNPTDKRTYTQPPAHTSPKFRDQIKDNQIFDEQQWLNDKIYTNQYAKKSYKQVQADKPNDYSYNAVKKNSYKEFEDDDLVKGIIGAFSTNASKYNSDKKSKEQDTIENVEQKETLFESLTKIFSDISPKETTKQKDEIDNKDSFEDEPIVEESIENMNIKPSDFDFKTLFVVLFIGALIGLVYFILKKKN